MNDNKDTHQLVIDDQDFKLEWWDTINAETQEMTVYHYEFTLGNIKDDDDMDS